MDATTVLLRRFIWAGAAIAALAVAVFLFGRATSHATTPESIPSAAPAQAAQQAVSPLEWAQYLHDSGRDGFTSDSTINAVNAFNLAHRPGWPVSLGGKAISTQPVVDNGVVYSGSWDGNEYALCAATCTTTSHGQSTMHASGAVLWKTPLGTTTPADPASCGGTIGVASTPAIATVTMAHDSKPSQVLYVGGGGNDSVGGGNGKLVALDASSGAIRWQTALGPAPATLIYSSPVVYTPAGATDPSVYIGVSSYADCPLVRGRVVQVDATTGAIQHQFYVVPEGCVGGGVWGSPVVDAKDGSLYFATGNGLPCVASPTYNEALIKVRASDLQVVSAWEVPASESSADNDFGSVPTLFSGTATKGGARRSLVGIGSKNGIFYVFDRTNLAAGPVIALHIAIGGTCGECGAGIIAPAAYDGSTLYIAGGAPPGGNGNKGVVDGFDPNALDTPLWIHGTSGILLGAVTAAPGIVVVSEGNQVLILNAHTGDTVATLPPSTGMYYAAPSISHGVLYAADTAGLLTAYSINGA